MCLCVCVCVHVCMLMCVCFVCVCVRDNEYFIYLLKAVHRKFVSLELCSKYSFKCSLPTNIITQCTTTIVA